jgi:aspartate kinase
MPQENSMIVMKFGGSSVASAEAIRYVASIVQAQLHRQPVVVVSAMGKTTDKLADILANASQKTTGAVSRLQAELKEYHFAVAQDLLHGSQAEGIDTYLRGVFRNLHVKMLEICEEDSPVTPALRDCVLSLGEQLSSRIVAAALQNCQIDTIHQDARQLIVTDRRFTQAVPQYWETLAKIRWTVPLLARKAVVVLGGFIGSTEQGETTTLGRGGSDLTASLVGAGINAEEIQVWKDVDGMLTCDPRLKPNNYCLKSLSYEEAAALAQAGAKILHPDTVAPARRLRIPLVLKNTFQPDLEGTRITAAPVPSKAPVKSIACKSGLTVLEIRPLSAQINLADCATGLCQACSQQGVPASLLGASESAVYLSIDTKADYSQLRFPLEQCLQVRIHPQQAQFTLVGEGLKAQNLQPQISRLLEHLPTLFMPAESGSCLLRFLVPAKQLLSCLEAVHNFLFKNPDPALFVPAADFQPQLNQRSAGSVPFPVPAANRNLWFARRKLAFLK